MSALPQRVRFNELVNVLRSLDPQRLADVTTQFPGFTEEVVRGPDAGPGEPEYDAALERAQFSVELCEGILQAGQTVTENVLTHAASISRSRVAVALIGGLFGVALLAAIGLAKEEVARVSGIATAVVAVLNATLDIYARRYSSAEVQRAIELRQSLNRLGIANNALRAAIRIRDTQPKLSSATEQCNEQALAVGKSVDLLRVL